MKHLILLSFLLTISKSYCQQKNDLKFRKNAINEFIKNKNVVFSTYNESKNILSIVFKDGFLGKLVLNKTDSEDFNVTEIKLTLLCDSLPFGKEFLNKKNDKKPLMNHLFELFPNNNWILIDGFIKTAFKNLIADANNPANYERKEGKYIAVGVNPDLGDELNIQIEELNKNQYVITIIYFLQT
jgi:hypothetical protein